MLFSLLFYLDFVLERLLVSCHELHVRPLALNIALQRQQFNQLRKFLEGIKTIDFHLTQYNDRLSAVGDTAEDLTWDSLAHIPIARVNTYLQLKSGIHFCFHQSFQYCNYDRTEKYSVQDISLSVVTLYLNSGSAEDSSPFSKVFST